MNADVTYIAAQAPTQRALLDKLRAIVVKTVPDATVSMLSIHVEDLGNDRVRVSGAKGRAASEFYKVSATYRAGSDAVNEFVNLGT